MNKQHFDWAWFDICAETLADKIRRSDYLPSSIYGVPRGGLPLAVRLSYLLDVPLVQCPESVDQNTLIVDDLSDSGKTLTHFMSVWFEHGAFLPRTACLMKAAATSYEPTFYMQEKGDRWVVFPWEAGAPQDTVSQVTPE